jgi:hypothetical protein
MLVAALSFVLLQLLPINFTYWQFAGILLMNGIGMGLFASPNRAGIMNSLPPERRGVGAGMGATFQNSAMVLSIGIFFTLIILGLSSSLPTTLSHGLVAQGVPAADAARVAALPPVSVMFAALLGYNPIQTLLGPVVNHLPASHAAYLTGHTFFPSLISAPFSHGLDIAFDFSLAACLIAALASLLRGGKYVHGVDALPVNRGARKAAGAARADAAPAGSVPAAESVLASTTLATAAARRTAANGVHANGVHANGAGGNGAGGNGAGGNGHAASDTVNEAERHS